MIPEFFSSEIEKLAAVNAYTCQYTADIYRHSKGIPKAKTLYSFIRNLPFAIGANISPQTKDFYLLNLIFSKI